MDIISEQQPGRRKKTPEPQPKALKESIEFCLESNREILRNLQSSDGSWDFHAHLGTHFLSQYWLVLNWLGLSEARLDKQRLKTELLKTQNRDGSWSQLQEVVAGEGEINATIFNYWFCKASELASEDLEVQRALARAKDFILSKGGLASSSVFTKTFLALFSQSPWNSLARVPYLIFVENVPMNYKSFSQWVIPHLLPIAYLRANKVAKDLGPKFSLTELWQNPIEMKNNEHRKPDIVFDRYLLEKILGQQQPKGSWGGYTVSSLLSVMALQHGSEADFAPRARIDVAILKGLEFVAELYLGDHPGAYLGCLMDGHYWDTILIANALYEAGEREEKDPSFAKALELIRTLQQPNGGFPYGWDFEYAPDVDDTAEAILLFSRTKKADSVRVKSAGDWLIARQNSDGGWGAFDHDNVGNVLLRKLTREFSDSVDLFDDSSADSTGHVLDALACLGFHCENSNSVRKGVEYLKKSQDPEIGGWEGRWGVNWLFGTACALVGMARAKLSSQDPSFAKALKFILSRQNSDGGFGESVASYRDRSQVGVGPSTPSQTAWALWALSTCGQGKSEAAHRAAKFLTQQFSAENGWKDGFATGTGHPGLLYMHYPSYSAAFPMQALALFKRDNS